MELKNLNSPIQAGGAHWFAVELSVVVLGVNPLSRPTTPYQAFFTKNCR